MSKVLWIHWRNHTSSEEDKSQDRASKDSITKKWKQLKQEKKNLTQKLI